MAGSNIPARFVLTGIAHRVDTRTLQATDTQPARQVADVVVLTDGGGFASVSFSPDATASTSLPSVGERVEWSTEVAVWNRRRRDGDGSYAALYVKYVGQAAAAPAIALSEQYSAA